VSTAPDPARGAPPLIGSNPVAPGGIPSGVKRAFTMADDGLVRRAQAGDRAAFDDLYARHAGRVYAVCLRMAGHVGEAERLTQDAFVLAWRRLASFRGDSAFSSWLHRIAVNAVLEDRRRARRRGARLEAAANQAALEPARSLRIEERMDLERAIAALPERARAVLVLHDIEGYRHDEIAALLGIATGTAKAQLHRARRLLRGKLAS